MPILHVVFDTNVYRTLPLDALRELRERERGRSVVALASYWPTIELAAHVADPLDRAHARSRQALAALWEHARTYDGRAYVLQLVADTESELAHGLFQLPIQGRTDEAQIYGYAVGMVSSAPSEPVPSELQPVFDRLRGHVQEKESEFADDMFAIVRELDPSATGWQPFASDPARRGELLTTFRHSDFLHRVARNRVEATAAQVGVNVEDSELLGRVESLLHSFPTAMRFYRNLLIGLVESGVNYRLPKHMNSLWDMHLCFLVSPHASIDGVPAVLVTNERKIATAAKDAGHREFVLTLAEYSSLIVSGAIYDVAERLRRKSS